jgi:hypothetical protein
LRRDDVGHVGIAVDLSEGANRTQPAGHAKDCA